MRAPDRYARGPSHLLAAIVLLAGGCGFVEPATLDPVVVARAPAVARAHVEHVGLDPATIARGPSPSGRLIVELTITNEGDGPLGLDPQRAIVRLERDPARSSPGDATLIAEAWGAGALPTRIPNRRPADVSPLLPGAAARLWISFTGFPDAADRADADREMHVRLRFPLPNATTLELPLASPGQGGPSWVLARTTGPTSLRQTVGVSVTSVPGAERLVEARVLGTAFGPPGRLAYEWSVGLISAPLADRAVGQPDGRAAAGVAHSFAIMHPFRSAMTGASLSVAPSLELTVALLGRPAGDPVVYPSEPADTRVLWAPSIGITFLVDRHVPAPGPFPLIPPRTTFGNVQAFRIAYARWFGTLERDRDSAPDDGTGALVASLRFGIGG